MVASAITASRASAASDLDDAGHLVFASDAIVAYGFESYNDAVAVGASWIDYDGNHVLKPTLVDAGSWSAAGAGAADAIQGEHAVKIAYSNGHLGLVLRDEAKFTSLANRRVEVTMWGRSEGAEPTLKVIYATSASDVGPNGSARVSAIRTGRETSDGWVEYSTGPIAGSVWGRAITAILLSARYAVDAHPGSDELDYPSFPTKSGSLDVEDPNAYAILDAVEIRPAAGDVIPTDPPRCTQQTRTTACGADGACMYGRCVDPAVVWGPAPAAADHRADLVARWSFLASSLGGDRRATAGAASLFTPSAVAAVSAATTPAPFFEGLNGLVAGLRDSHTLLEFPPSSRTDFYPVASSRPDGDSGTLDLCFGAALDDVSGPGAVSYAVFWVSPTGVAQGKVPVGAILKQIDGQAPDAWLASLGATYLKNKNNDPAADPSATAVVLAELMGRYANTAVFTTCTLPSTCTSATLAVSDLAFTVVQRTAPRGITYATRQCTPRFVDGVSTWTPDDDDATFDVPKVETTADGITTIEFDGFDSAFDDGSTNDPYHTWVDPFATTLATGGNVVVDARQGHGGAFSLGYFLAGYLRGASDPASVFIVPRGNYATADPPWLFDASMTSCDPLAFQNICEWTGGLIMTTHATMVPGVNTKVAWMNANDMSMNDFVPRLLQGRANFRVFGPHPTDGAYGEISELPSFSTSWWAGAIQILDSRFAPTLDQALIAPWASGSGVVPDQVVIEKVSDMLATPPVDTVVAAARAWVAQ